MFELRSTFDNDVMNPMLLGSAPVRLLLYNIKFCKDVIFPILGGMEPLSRLELISSVTNDEKPEMLSGIVPFNLRLVKEMPTTEPPSQVTPLKPQ